MAMELNRAKIYSDGSNYIAIPQSPKLQQRKHLTEEEIRWKQLANSPPSQTETKPPTNKPKTESTKAMCERLLQEHSKLPKAERQQKVIDELLPRCNNDYAKAKTYVAETVDRLTRNRISRMVRLKRKLYLQEWTHFVTFTYDDSKHTEETFRKQLLTCLRHLAHRKGWKYVGVFERSPENKRLHFHAIMYVPEMIGSIVETKDYNTKEHKMQTAYQNTHFLKRFGRNDFQPLDKHDLPFAMWYLVKYINKTGEKIIYSRNLPTYFVADVKEEDILCTFGIDDRKYLLFQNFTCWYNGECVGKVSPETISKLPKRNN